MAGDAHVLPASLLSGTRAGSPEEKNSGTVKINHDDIKHDAAIKYFAKPKSKRHKADTGNPVRGLKAPISSDICGVRSNKRTHDKKTHGKP